jgi:hypothetical protein
MIMSTRRENSETYNTTGRPPNNSGWNSEFERVFLLAGAKIRGELAASRIRGETVCDRVPRDSVFPHRPARSKRSLLRRWFDSFTASQQRRADREIARYLATCGRITDSTEREIERRFLFGHGERGEHGASPLERHSRADPATPRRPRE